MIKFFESYIQHKDKRGTILGIINQGNWEEINFIKSKKGSIRGGHFHQYTRELFYILKGKIEIKIQEVKNKKLFGEQRIINVNPNDIFLIEPNYIHTFKIIEDAEWINVLSKKIDKKNPDILKLEK